MKRFLVEDAPAAYRSEEFLKGLTPAPRFRGQGSYSYKTLNDPVPEHTPPQQIDIDDGVFLPTSFLSQGGRPVLAARSYFKVVEDALRPLCEARGWTLCSNKPSCVRVLLNAKAHTDLALYAIPDDEYAKVELLEKVLRDKGLFADSAELAEPAYRNLPDDQIMLARRDGTWLPSDPRKLGDWFQDAVNRHGAHLRHVSRYLKAWRDFEWKDPEAGISSITLMAMTVRCFDENRQRLDANREDDALLAVAERMPVLLRSSIQNPVLPELRLDSEWSEEARRGFVAAADRLCEHLRLAQSATRTDAVISRLKTCLGARIPSDSDLVEVVAAEEERILAQPRTYVAAQPVGRTTSG
jgi:hypothetical protein